MTLDRQNGARLLVTALVIWVTTATVLAFALPLFPIDENRVLTVAWEMRVNGDWLLPTMNYSPYAHKPPLLFWLINGSWSLFGETVGAVRALMAAITAGVIIATYRLGTAVFPDRTSIAGLATVLLLAIPPIAIHGAMVMYDLMLTLCIVAGLIALWRAAATPAFWPWILYGLAIGLGVLSKGPVVLVFLLGPALFVAYWSPDPEIKLGTWFPRLLFGILIGAAVALSWAIPAALTGGQDYAELIFWKQSADRVAGTMHHKRPFWYYIPVVLGFVAPLFLWPPAWRAVKCAMRDTLEPQVRFLIACIAPTLIFMSAVGGKQIHYILPIVPPLALLAARYLDRVEADTRQWYCAFAPYAVGFLGLAALPFVLHVAQPDTSAASELWSRIENINSLWYAGGLCLSLVLCVVLRASLARQAIAMAASSVLVLISLALQFPRSLDKLYDLEGLAAALHPYEQGPIGFAGRYLGQIGYPARLTHSVEVIPERGVGNWLAAHPGAVAIVHDIKPKDAKAFEILHSQPYGLDQSLHLIKAKPPQASSTSGGSSVIR